MNDFQPWLVDRLPPDEDLDRPVLAELATVIGREPRLWKEFVRHDPDERFYLQLYRDVHVDVWLICWLNEQDTGFHDHDLSSGAVYVADGVLIEDRFQRIDGNEIRETSRQHPAGTVFDFDSARIHRMRHPGGAPATSIHVYSPALWRMGYYEPDADGNLCRTSITYVDEMGAG